MENPKMISNTRENEQSEQIQLMREALFKYKVQFENDRTLKAELVEANRQIEELRRKESEFERIESFLTDLEAKIEDEAAEIDNMREERDILRRQNEERSVLISEAAKSLEHYFSEIEDKEERVSQLETDNLRKEAQIAELQTELETALQNQTLGEAARHSQLETSLYNEFEESSAQFEQSSVPGLIDDALFNQNNGELDAEDEELRELEIELHKSRADTIEETHAGRHQEIFGEMEDNSTISEEPINREVVTGLMGSQYACNLPSQDSMALEASAPVVIDPPDYKDLERVDKIARSIVAKPSTDARQEIITTHSKASIESLEPRMPSLEAKLASHIKICGNVDQLPLLEDDDDLSRCTSELINILEQDENDGCEAPVHDCVLSRAEMKTQLSSTMKSQDLQNQCLNSETQVEFEKPRYKNLEYPSDLGESLPMPYGETTVKIYQPSASRRRGPDLENSIDNDEMDVEVEELIGSNEVLEEELLLANTRIEQLNNELEVRSGVLNQTISLLHSRGEE